MESRAALDIHATSLPAPPGIPTAEGPIDPGVAAIAAGHASAPSQPRAEASAPAAHAPPPSERAPVVPESPSAVEAAPVAPSVEPASVEVPAAAVAPAEATRDPVVPAAVVPSAASEAAPSASNDPFPSPAVSVPAPAGELSTTIHGDALHETRPGLGPSASVILEPEVQKASAESQAIVDGLDAPTSLPMTKREPLASRSSVSPDAGATAASNRPKKLDPDDSSTIIISNATEPSDVTEARRVLDGGDGTWDGEDEGGDVVRRQSGRKVVVRLLLAIATFAVLGLAARHFVRGSHDSGKELSIRPTAIPSTPTASAPATTAAPPVSPSAAPALPSTAAPLLAPPGATLLHSAARVPGPLPVSPGPGPGAPAVPGPAAGPVTPSAAASGSNNIEGAQQALESKNTFKAVDLAQRAVRNNPKNPEAWLTLGAAFEASGRPGQARAAYKSCAAQADGPRVSECRALAGE